MAIGVSGKLSIAEMTAHALLDILSIQSNCLVHFVHWTWHYFDVFANVLNEFFYLKDKPRRQENNDLCQQLL